MDNLSILVFSILVIGALILDLKFIGGKKEVSTKTALIWTIIFISIAVGFGLFLRYEHGAQISNEFFTAYAIEKVLSVDNLFVFILVFSFFDVPKIYHHKVLFYGIIGAFVLRAIFIFTGATLIKYTYLTIANFEVNVVLTLFGGILIWKGYGALMEYLGDDEEDKDFSKTAGARFITWITRGKITNSFDKDRFFVKRWEKDDTGVYNWVTYGTLLLVVVGVVEFTDVLFAVDSIPAIFSVTQNKMVLYTSNIFAILGLRTMYFLLANLKDMFRYLGLALAFILAFIGFKMVAAPWIHISGPLSLYIVLGVLTLSIIISLLNPEKKDVEISLTKDEPGV